MKTREFSRILLALAAALLLADCSGGNGYTSGSMPIFASGPTYYVSSSLGNDLNMGTSGSPFKTITKGLMAATAAGSGSAVSVAPGAYNTLETFPLMVPDEVQLIGDEVYKGLGIGLSPVHTTISGGGISGIANVGATIVPGNGSTVAGFEIINTTDASGAFPSGIVLTNSNATIRNNTVTGSTSVGIYVGAGAGNKVQTNTITLNAVGVQFDVAGADFGGGSVSSTGGNLLSCNTSVDLFVNTAVAISIFAKGNSWDHAAPTTAASVSACNATSGIDICNLSGLAPDTTNSVGGGTC
jgi:parallel beta-helix repeat protein